MRRNAEENALFRFYRKAQAMIAPELKYSQAIYESVLEEVVGEGKRWMDLGCGHQLLPPWRDEEEKRLAQRAGTLVGFDYDLDALRRHRTIAARVRGDISTLPFAAETFDLVSSNMVFEHLKEPDTQLTEIFRVLRPGGLLIFHTPNALGYGVIAGRALPDWVKTRLAWILQGRAAEDVYPTFYRINSIRAIGELAARSGFRVHDIRTIVSTPILVMIPPLVVLELLLLRALMTTRMRSFRTNIIAVLEKPPSPAPPLRGS